MTITVTAWQPLAISLMHAFESCKLRAYPDPGSKDGHPWTIGWGSTGPDIGPGTVWTQQQCDDRFAADLAKFGGMVARLVEGVPTTAHQFAALVCFHYNTGSLGPSTLLKLHRTGNYAGAKAEFARWIYNDGKPMNGLKRRRAAEAELYGKADA